MSSPASLFKPHAAGALELAHRIVLAPMTRIRASASDFTPHPTAAEYYAQRATPGGLLISEATHVSPEGTPIWRIYPAVADGSSQVPGLWTEEHVAAWKVVTEAVHARGALMCCQLLHCGRVAQPDIGEHQAVRGSEFPLPSVSSSAVGITPAPPKTNSDHDSSGSGHYTWDKPTALPRALSVDEISRVVGDYKRAARYALRAGFDAVELHAAHGYLINQFMCDGVNCRTDGYGGKIANRCRLLFEVVQALIDVVGPGRVGVRLSPTSIDAHTGQPSQVYFDCADSDPEALYAHAVSGLNSFPLAYLLLTEPRCGSLGLAAVEDAGLRAPIANRRFRALYHGTLMGAGGFTPAGAAAAVQDGEYDLVAFGRWFLANPDLPHRLQTGAPLNVYDRATFYGGGHKGYIDYPDLAGTITPDERSAYETMEQADIGQSLAEARSRVAKRAREAVEEDRGAVAGVR